MRFRFVLLCLLILMISTTTDAAEPTPGKQVEQSLQVSDSQEVPYLLYLPKEYGEDEEKDWPVVLFLHGRGESNGPLSLVAKWGPPRFAARGDDLPFILVSPQCPREQRWTSEEQLTGVMKLLDHVQSNFKADDKRLYLTGLSLGGYGSWRLAADHPKKFAAVVPICGGGDPADAEKLQNIPMWVFHGDQDGAVPFERSQQMVDAIRAAGGESIRFTTLEHIGHNSWSAAYATEDLWSWLLRQELGD